MTENDEKKPESSQPQSEPSVPPTAKEMTDAAKALMEKLLEDSQQQMLGSCLVNAMRLYTLARELILGDPRFPMEVKLEVIKQLRDAVSGKGADKTFDALGLVKDLRENLVVVEKVLQLIEQQRRQYALAFRKSFLARKEPLTGPESVFNHVLPKALEWGALLHITSMASDERSMQTFIQAVCQRLAQEGWGVVAACAAKPGDKLSLSELRGMFNKQHIDFLFLSGGYTLSDLEGFRKVLVANKAVGAVVAASAADATPEYQQLTGQYLDGMVFLNGMRLSELPLSAAPKIEVAPLEGAAEDTSVSTPVEQAAVQGAGQPGEPPAQVAEHPDVPVPSVTEERLIETKG